MARTNLAGKVAEEHFFAGTRHGIAICLLRWGRRVSGRSLRGILAQRRRKLRKRCRKVVKSPMNMLHLLFALPSIWFVSDLF